MRHWRKSMSNTSEFTSYPRTSTCIWTVLFIHGLVSAKGCILPSQGIWTANFIGCLLLCVRFSSIFPWEALFSKRRLSLRGWITFECNLPCLIKNKTVTTTTKEEVGNNNRTTKHYGRDTTGNYVFITLKKNKTLMSKHPSTWFDDGLCMVGEH